jgi:hypothetical protein
VDCRYMAGVLLLTVVPSAISLHAQDPKPTVSAVRIPEGTIRIDGRLDEPEWQRAESGRGFTQREPHDGAPESERTEVRVLYSDAAIYVGIRAYDSNPDEIRAHLARRDRESQSDEVAIYFDSYYDRRTAFEFAVNPRGSIKDVYYFNDNQWSRDLTWDPVWQVNTSVDSLGWVAEFRIPLTQLRFDEKSSTWGFQVARHIVRKAEITYWSPFSLDASGFVSHFGTLEGLTGLKQPMRLEVRPYTVVNSRFRPEQDGFLYAPSREAGFNMGLDLQYGITSDFTLDLAVNPDFGQVEADPAFVNLSAFETFYPEQRPFFVEGSGLFQKSINIGQLFYSRRIGRPPQGFAFPPSGGTVEIPDRTTILSAGKVTGKSAGGLGLGIMSAVTRKERAVIRYPDGNINGREIIEPLTHYFISRVEQDFKEGSQTVGVMITAVNRRLTEELAFLHRDAYTVHLDGTHRFRNNSYYIEWQFGGSSVRGSEGALVRTQTSSLHYFQRPDAEHLSVDSSRTSLTGYNYQVRGGKRAGRWQYGAGYEYSDPNMNINDAGFQWRSTDRQNLWLWLHYIRSQPSWVFNNFRLGIDMNRTGTTGGELMSTWFRPIFISGTFKNNWSIGLNPMAFRITNRVVTALRGGPTVRGDLWSQQFMWLNTDSRKTVSFNFNILRGKVFGTGNNWYGMWNGMTVRPGETVNFSLSVGYDHNINPIQWVTRRIVFDETRYILATIEQKTINVQLRTNWIVSPTLSIEFYVQPFVSAGTYSEYKEVREPMARDFNDRYRWFGDNIVCAEDNICRVDLNDDGVYDISFGKPDFNFRQLQSTFVLRWEYRPGSVLFVAWQHGRNIFEPHGNFGGLGDMGELFSVPSDNIILLKMNYWFSY